MYFHKVWVGLSNNWMQYIVVIVLKVFTSLYVSFLQIRQARLYPVTLVVVAVVVEVCSVGSSSSNIGSGGGNGSSSCR